MKRVILASVATFFLHTATVAAEPEVYSNCFEIIVAGEYPTLVFTQNRDVQIKIESCATGAHEWWTVSDASITGSIVFASCEVGSRIVTANFGSGGNHISKDFSPFKPSKINCRYDIRLSKFIFTDNLEAGDEVVLDYGDNWFFEMKNGMPCLDRIKTSHC